MRIVPPQRSELIFGAGLWLFCGFVVFVFAGPLTEISAQEVLSSSIFASVGVMFAYAELLRRSLRVDIDRATGLIEIQRRNWRWGLVRKSYLLSRFGRVRSIFALRGKYPKIRVELVEREHLRALTLAVFSPGSYFHDQEPEAAGQLRQEIADFTGMPDGGYEGVQFPMRASVSDSRP